VRLEKTAVDARGRFCVPGVRRRRRLIPEFDAEVPPVGEEFLDQRGCGSDPDVQFLERVIIDGVKVDVLVAPALARSRVRLAREVQVRPPVRLRLRGGGRGRNG
jgi:hypothetical protein